MPLRSQFTTATHERQIGRAETGQNGAQLAMRQALPRCIRLSWLDRTLEGALYGSPSRGSSNGLRSMAGRGVLSLRHDTGQSLGMHMDLRRTARLPGYANGARGHLVFHRPCTPTCATVFEASEVRYGEDRASEVLR